MIRVFLAALAATAALAAGSAGAFVFTPADTSFTLQGTMTFYPKRGTPFACGVTGHGRTNDQARAGVQAKVPSWVLEGSSDQCQALLIQPGGSDQEVRTLSATTAELKRFGFFSGNLTCAPRHTPFTVDAQGGWHLAAGCMRGLRRFQKG